jgi:hypothetical protein
MSYAELRTASKEAGLKANGRKEALLAALEKI